MKTSISDSIFFFIINLCVYYINCKQGECVKKIWSSNEWMDLVYCCRDYEMRNGSCAECKFGFTSNNGSDCWPCSDSYYGRKCLQSCKCTANERCHHIEGCISLKSTSFKVISEEMSYTVYTRTTDTVNEIEDVITTHNELYKKDIMVYTACIVGLLLIVTLCYIIVTRIRNKNTRNITGQEEHGNRQHQNVEINQIADSDDNSIALDEYDYDEIDENVLQYSKEIYTRHIQNNQESCSEDSSDEDAEETVRNDGYQNPYQPIIEDLDIHDYNTTDLPSRVPESINLKVELGPTDTLSSNSLGGNKYFKILDFNVPSSSVRYNRNKSLIHQHSSEINYRLAMGIWNGIKVRKSMIELKAPIVQTINMDSDVAVYKSSSVTFDKSLSI